MRVPRPTVSALTATATAFVVTIGGLTLATPAVAAPEPGQCYSYPASTLTAPSSAAPAIDCAAAHTAQTFYVGTVREAFGIPSRSTQAMRLSAGRACTPRMMNAFVGMPDRKLPSRFRTVVLFPTDAQWAAGERWFRCDVVLQGGLTLKEFTGTAAALVAATPQTQFDFCTPGQPNAKATAAYPCTSPKKNWIKVLAASLGGPGTSFPGLSSVERRTRKLCERQGKRWSGKVTFPGWWAIWPTAVGWRKGNRIAQCFVPYQQYAKQLEIDAAKKVPPTPPTLPPAPVPTPTIEPGPVSQ